MTNKLAKAKLASNKAANTERKGAFRLAKESWAVARMRWDALGSRVNKDWCAAREQHCSVMAMDDEEE